MCTKKHNIRLSVFFPCFNETFNLKGLVCEAIEVLNGLVQEYELLIINDGSTDDTRHTADRLCSKHKNVRVINHQINRGYGAALASGFNNSLYDWIFFTDGDNQFFINEIEYLLDEIENYDIVIGFRKNRQDPWHRLVYAQAWNFLVGTLFDIKFKDINCAFKLIRKRVLEGITFLSSGAVISTELLAKSVHSGAHVKEIGVSHRPRKFGIQTGGNPKVIFTAFLELYRLYRELNSPQ